ncbi:hypothetical protein DFQ27_009752 [Actinomortierella ambigua]|uniref:RlpA-like protein double-psi beta-barrel domain-containing protein n=1 Tax=Actinomortierella ambigua TaxID=1343610 RepID=A0A9P6QHP3_9FUNG|nr:hypothetical protein DFQ26_003143 [Actinomortierella ambigua]KAG0266450.1 hypothetical protein DFQ27_009752 [Actinomortierella ambigua]
MKISFSLLTIAALFAASTADAQMTIRNGKSINKGISTWFDGSHLKGAACYGRLMNRNVNARDSWRIAAVNFKYFRGADKGACFKCARVSRGKKSVDVRIIDGCRSCKSGQIDLTKSAFSRLAPLKEGRIGVKITWIPCDKKPKYWPNSPKP